ncbi:methyltransferase [Chaetomidium leptoderma]|uniref:Methyltransferase n=1 Tax=Chaetomidium leptoderma TaxID=669021 RepID=A0AAN6ZX24_9PEZI|nr:methyltransferase [Chaetomidium leptoderma]
MRTAENSATHLLPHLQPALQKNPHLRLLDVGAGPGTLSASLAKHLLPHGHVVAIDISDAVLARAEEHATTLSVQDHMTFQKASVYALPFADGEFDVVHAHQVLCHLDAPVDAVREMLRVCKPRGGGLLALREADVQQMWCVWPQIPALGRFHDLMAATLVANGGQEMGGRRLVSWLLEAGVGRGEIEAGFGTSCYSTPKDRRDWGEAMIERLRTGQMRDKGIELGITTEEGIDEMVEGWQEWIEAADATLGIMNGEVIVIHRKARKRVT